MDAQMNSKEAQQSFQDGLKILELETKLDYYGRLVDYLYSNVQDIPCAIQAFNEQEKQNDHSI